MWDFLRSLFRPPGPRPPAGFVYDVANEGGSVVLAVRADGRPGVRRYILPPTEARNLSVLLAMAAGRADGRDD